MATTGVDFCMVKYRSEEGEDCRVKIWDTAGQERFRNLTNTFFRDAKGVIIVFDLTNQVSFLNCRDWIGSVHKYTDPKLPMVLVGNKLDLADEDNGREVNQQIAEDFARQSNMQYFETSAKTDTGVNELMTHMFGITYAYKMEQIK